MRRPSRDGATAGGRRSTADQLPTDDASPNRRSIVDALHALQRELRLIEGREVAGVGLPPAQARVLQALGRQPAGSLAELAGRTHTDPSSASVVVQRLVDAGLVARVPARDDRRRTELSLTAAGRGRLRRAQATNGQRLHDAFGRLGERRTALLAETLQTLAAALRDADDAPSGDDGSPAGPGRTSAR